MSTVPFFLTGANAKILINNRTMAYCTNVSYRVSVRHASPRVLGRFEVETIQPLSYDVSGTMTLIKYARGLRDFIESSKEVTAPANTSQKGNGLGSLGPQGIENFDPRNLFDGQADEGLIPGRLFQAQLFDIEIRQRLPDGYGKGNSAAFDQRIQQSAANLLTGAGSNGRNETTIVLLRGCRIEDYNFHLERKGAATITLSFKARYADDDTFIARKSGVGQELV